MRLIKTEDGSETYYNEKFDEPYHTKSGAMEEAFEKHVVPLDIKDGMSLLDFCFGLGYNSFAACSNNSNLKITALENDIIIIKKIKEINFPKKLARESEIFKELDINREITDRKNNVIRLILDDALNAIERLPSNSFDRVFFDPFSPKKHPEMWSENVFKEMFRIMKKNGKLSTYSCARRVRDNMKLAGFKVIDGPIIGRRSPSTIAIKN